MGLERAKSLLPVRDGLTFLDLIVRQVLHFRKTSGHVRLLAHEQLQHQRRHAARRWQNIPSSATRRHRAAAKQNAQGGRRRRWNPWRGRKGSRTRMVPAGPRRSLRRARHRRPLDRLLADGIRYVFVSNSDNLGATLDLALLTWFAQSGAPFLMEVTARTRPTAKAATSPARRSRKTAISSSSANPRNAPMKTWTPSRTSTGTATSTRTISGCASTACATRSTPPTARSRSRSSAITRPSIRATRHSPEVFQLETAMGAAIECSPMPAPSMSRAAVSPR